MNDKKHPPPPRYWLPRGWLLCPQSNVGIPCPTEKFPCSGWHWTVTGNKFPQWGPSGFVSPPCSSCQLSLLFLKPMRGLFPPLGSLHPALARFLGPKGAGVPDVLPPGCLATFPAEYLQSRWGLLVVQEAASPLRCVGGGGRLCPGCTRVPAACPAIGGRRWDGGILKK